ncbi:hypothetical protein [uncultured Mycobacterium sp.]|uniref:hypothetical protein n=1 Tax=uncultured Mycobacterium sp. TaxID=171292 RepID=UPI0035CB22A1
MAPRDVVRIVVDRDSVGVADDIENHREIWEFPARATLDDLLVWLAEDYVVPMTFDSMWCIHLQQRADASDGHLLAVIYACYQRPPDRPFIRLTRVWTGERSLLRLARRLGPQPLRIHARYVSSDAIALKTPDVMKASRYCTGAAPRRRALSRTAVSRASGT